MKILLKKTLFTNCNAEESGMAAQDTYVSLLPTKKTPGCRSKALQQPGPGPQPAELQTEIIQSQIHCEEQFYVTVEICSSCRFYLHN